LPCVLGHTQGASTSSWSSRGLKTTSSIR
jgi:hypothetical protein